MLFSSLEYILLFLPVTVLAYYAAARAGRAAPLYVLGAASLLFYAYWRPVYLPLLLVSIALNFALGESIRNGTAPARRRALLTVGVAANVLLLGAFKYYNFLGGNFTAATGFALPPLRWELPLGISFYTFVQIAYLVDCAKGRVPRTGPLEYGLFVTYFPHLIAGPIVHHGDLMPQFFAAARRRFHAENFARGLFLFSLGLVKKTLLADNLAGSVALVFDDAHAPAFFEGWVGALAYTLQLYFDFSGYSDMALGASLLLNIELPANFDSPYRSRNIAEFWRRWHMTLSRWLRDYIYIPLGGNRGPRGRTYRNLFLTFVVGGIWHGAGFTFLLWGMAHGAALVAQREFQRRGGRMGPRLATGLTFFFVLLCWVPFRARDLKSAGRVFGAMLGRHGLVLHEFWGFPNFGKLFPFTLALCAASALVAFLAPNSGALTRRLELKPRWALASAALLALGLLSANTAISQEFLYFDF